MSERTTSGRGDRARAFIALAGALAEQGIGEIEIVRPDAGSARLRARETDLPGVLAACEAGTRLVAASIGLELEITAPGPRCRRCETDAARAVWAAVAPDGSSGAR